MNREILFRGKRIDNGEWVYGSLIKGKSSTYFIFDCTDCDILKDNVLSKFIQVDHKTVGQFTGLHDKNGTKIFEGDILKVDTEFENSTIHRVIWGGSYPAFEIEPNPYDDCNGLQYVAHVGENATCEIIGNEHDNPDLLKGDL